MTLQQWPFHVNNGLVETCVRASTSLFVSDVRDIWVDSDKKKDRISFFLDWSETNGIKIKSLHYHSHGSLKHLDSKSKILVCNNSLLFHIFYSVSAHIYNHL